MTQFVLSTHCLVSMGFSNFVSYTDEWPTDPPLEFAAVPVGSVGTVCHILIEGRSSVS